MPKWDAWLGGLADVLGPLLLTVPPNLGSREPRRPRSTAAAGLAPPRPRRAHDRRRDPADDDEHRRPARRLVRVAAGQGRARGQRRDRHLGRPVRARHRLRDGAPLDRRRRRRPAGQLGLSRGRHGRGRPTAIASSARSVRRRDPHQRPGRAAPGPRRPGRTASCWRTARSSRAARGHQPAPADRVPATRSTRSDLPDDFVSDIEHWKTRSGVVKINLALAELPNFTADPSTSQAEHHTGSVEMAPTMEYIERGLPGRPRGPARGCAVQRRRHPDDASTRR